MLAKQGGISEAVTICIADVFRLAIIGIRRLDDMPLAVIEKVLGANFQRVLGEIWGME